MLHYNSDPSRFPVQITQAVLPDGTQVGDFIIREVVSVTGNELCYRAEFDGIGCLLFELLPWRWCSLNKNGVFVPFHAEAAAFYDTYKTEMQEKLEHLHDFADDAAIDLPVTVFEANGTLFTATKVAAGNTLRRECETRIYKAREAVHLLAPVLDTLAGLHEAGLCHGAVSVDTILVQGEKPALHGWLSAPAMGRANQTDDVRGMALVLWQMLTGCPFYEESAGESLSPQVRAAIFNALHDPDMTLSQFWKQLHAKRPAKRAAVAMLRSAKPSLLGRILSPALTVAFCFACIATPLLIWQYEAGALTNDTSEPMADVLYSLADDEIQIPELLYQEQDAAVRTLENMGLTVILAPREDNPVIPENQVLMQKPTAGAVVHAGDTVTLTVSDGWANAVPDLHGVRCETAREKLEALGFVVTTVEKVSPDDAPGMVIAQSVAPDTRLERGKTVVLTVSLGREDLDVTQMETVGDYVGMQFEDVRNALADLHLYAVQVETVYDTETLAGTILSQDIEPGKSVAQGTAVNLVVSKGVETSRVPDLMHLGAASAKAALEAAKLRCVICYVSNNEWQMDTVLSQSIASNELVAVGTEVWIQVSVGTGSRVESTGGWTDGPVPTYAELVAAQEAASETEEETETDTEDTTEDSSVPETDDAATEIPETEPVTEATEPEESPQDLTAPTLPLES